MSAREHHCSWKSEYRWDRGKVEFDWNMYPIEYEDIECPEVKFLDWRQHDYLPNIDQFQSEILGKVDLL